MVDHNVYQWKNPVPDFTPEGHMDIFECPVNQLKNGFKDLPTEIDRCAELGITDIELPPLAEHYKDPENGRKINEWGYNGTHMMAINANFGTPDELKAAIDHAHRKGINIILDVVPNHWGIYHNYLHNFMVNESHIATPYGSHSPNFEGPFKEYVLNYFTDLVLTLNKNYHVKNSDLT